MARRITLTDQDTELLLYLLGNLVVKNDDAIAEYDEQDDTDAVARLEAENERIERLIKRLEENR